MSCHGTVKSFNGGKGYGFLTNAQDGTDVFVHMSDCGGAAPAVGDEVTFDVAESPSKPGSSVAKNVVGCTGVPESQKGGGKGDKGGGGGKGQGSGAYQGSVKSFSELKAWGFIQHEDSDVFFHIKDMVDGSVPDRGDVVRYDVEENPHKPGTMKASNVSGGSKGKGQGKGNCGGGMPYEKGHKGGYGGGMDYGGKGGYGAAPMWGMDPWAGAGAWGPYGGGKGGGDPWGGCCGGWGGDAWGGKGNGKSFKGGW